MRARIDRRTSGHTHDVLKILLVVLLGSLAVAGSVTAVLVSPWWWAAACPLLVLALVAVHDLVQRRHSVLRNYPLLGHLRFALEALRPELQQYFIERNFDGRPFDRDTRSIVYERAKGTDAEEPFGTELDLYRTGSEFLTPSMAPDRCAPRRRVSESADPSAPGRTTWPCSTSRR